MKKVLNRVFGILQILIIIFVIMVTVFFLNKNNYGFTQFGDTTLINVDKNIAVNLKDIKPGNMLIISNSKKIKTGNFVYYYIIKNNKYVVKADYVTKSDNYYKFKEDGFVDEDRIIGVNCKKIALLGSFLSIVETKLGFLLIVFLPIFLIFVYQIYKFIRDSRNEKVAIASANNYAIVDDEII